MSEDVPDPDSFIEAAKNVIKYAETRLNPTLVIEAAQKAGKDIKIPQLQFFRPMRCLMVKNLILGSAFVNFVVLCCCETHALCQEYRELQLCGLIVSSVDQVITNGPGFDAVVYHHSLSCVNIGSIIKANIKGKGGQCMFITKLLAIIKIKSFMGLIEKKVAKVDIICNGDILYGLFRYKLSELLNLAPEYFKSCKLQEGEWGAVGSIIHWDYVLDGKSQVITQNIDAVDEKNKLISFKTLNGDLLKFYKSFKFYLQVDGNTESSTVHGPLSMRK
nr:kirola-like [Tanacetum cinerariifolium]